MEDSELLVRGSSHTGLVRGMNQDRIFFDKQMFALADGMGGHEDGEKAANIAMSAVQSALSDIQEPGTDKISDVIDNAILTCFQSAHDQIIRMTRQERKTAGTTLLVCYINDNQLYYYWSGDTKLFLFCEGSLTLLSRDHTVAQQKRDAGLGDLILPQDNHTLTRCLGVGHFENPEQKMIDLSIYENFTLLGVTDGYDDVALETIENILKSDDEIGQKLVQMELAVISKGASDNYSAVLCKKN